MSTTTVQLKAVDDGNITDVPADGVTVVGRGPFLDIKDKRVSRNHANLEVQDGQLFLTPIHVNPCFCKKGGTESQIILEKDKKFALEEGDVFGLLPDKLFFQVLYKKTSLNGEMKKEVDTSQTNGTTSINKTTNETVKDEGDEDWDKSSNHEQNIKSEPKPEVKNDKQSKAGPSTVVPPGSKEMALPLERKRQLPDWLTRAAAAGPSPEKKKPAPKVQATTKRVPRAATLKPVIEDFISDEEDAEVIPVKKQRGRPAARKPPPESDDDDEPVQKPSKGKPRTLTPGTKTPRRKDQYKGDDDDDESEDELLSRKAKPIPRRTARRPPSPESFTPSKRPVRAAKYARGSYEDELSDDSDEYGGFKKKEEDSDFVAEEDDSGSDWGASHKSHKAKGKGKSTPSRSPRSGKSRGRSRRSRSDDSEEDYIEEYVPRPSKRRASKVEKSESEEDESPPPKPKSRKKKKKETDDDDDEEDDQPIVKTKPKTNKSEKRKPCEFGKKCYRKNPTHFKEFCHPGDKSYDEEDENDSDEGDDDDKPECPYGKECLRTNARHKADYSHKSKPTKGTSRPKRDTAGKKSVLDGDEDDDGEINTYDKNDSFLDNNTLEESDASSPPDDGSESDYDPESEDVAGLLKEAKGFKKNQKMVKPARSR